MSSIDLPPDVLDAIAAPPDEREPIVRQELAVSLYRERYPSFGKPRELAGLSIADFH
jgi:predicted HTH domain antitoxin